MCFTAFTLTLTLSASLDVCQRLSPRTSKDLLDGENCITFGILSQNFEQQHASILQSKPY